MVNFYNRLCTIYTVLAIGAYNIMSRYICVIASYNINNLLSARPTIKSVGYLL